MVIPKNAKVNNGVFLKKVLIPIWKKDMPRLHPGEEQKVILHMDAAPAYFRPRLACKELDLSSIPLDWRPNVFWP